VGTAIAVDAGATASARGWLGRDLPPAHRDQRDVVVLGQFGVVESGSVALIEPAEDRACALLAEHLVVLLAADRLIASLAEALVTGHRLAAARAAPLLLLSGPSRTGDIERVLTIGVHGPAALTVLLVEGS
jgi:L-lactate dehydrogenase complex protein LldG